MVQIGQTSQHGYNDEGMGEFAVPDGESVCIDRERCLGPAR